MVFFWLQYTDEPFCHCHSWTFTWKYALSFEWVLHLVKRCNVKLFSALLLMTKDVGGPLLTDVPIFHEINLANIYHVKEGAWSECNVICILFLGKQSESDIWKMVLLSFQFQKYLLMNMLSDICVSSVYFYFTCFFQQSKILALSQSSTKYVM